MAALGVCLVLSYIAEGREGGREGGRKGVVVDSVYMTLIIMYIIIVLCTKY